MGGAKQPDDPASPLVEERKSIKGVTAEEAGGEQRKRHLLERHEEDDGDEAHGDIASAVTCRPPGTVRQCARWRVGGDGRIWALTPEHAFAQCLNHASGQAGHVGGLRRPALREVEDADIGTNKVSTHKRQNDWDGEHEEEEHKATEAGEGDYFAWLERCVSAAEASAIFLNKITVDVDALSKLVDAVLGRPALPLGANVGSVADTEHVERAEYKADGDGDEPKKVDVSV